MFASNNPYDPVSAHCILAEEDTVIDDAGEINIEAGKSGSPQPAGNIARRTVAKLLRVSQQAFRVPEREFLCQLARSLSGHIQFLLALIRRASLCDSYSMLLAGLFAGALFLGLLVGDWIYFIRLTPDAVRYGCRVATRPDQWPGSTVQSVRDRFGPDGVLMLPHGVAWWYPDLSQIAIRPQYRLFSRRFRTAWPVKGLIHVSPHDEALVAHCVKRIPWSSALITAIWFAVVLLGSLTFVVQYAIEGGFTTLGGAFLGIGITGLAGMVALFGIVTVTLSYRLEDSRLMQVYDELRAAITPPNGP